MNRLFTRRLFILVPLVSFFKIFIKPQKVYASSNQSPENWNLSKEEWKEKLSPESFYILREEGTERPFSSSLNDEKRKGIFYCAGCKLALFSSDKVSSSTREVSS